MDAFSHLTQDQITAKESLFIVESKTPPVQPVRRIRPRIGHLVALLLLVVGCCVVPPSVLGILSIVTGCAMLLVAFVFLVQMPARLLLFDRTAKDYFSSHKNSVASARNNANQQH